MAAAELAAVPTDDLGRLDRDPYLHPDEEPVGTVHGLAAPAVVEQHVGHPVLAVAVPDTDDGAAVTVEGAKTLVEMTSMAMLHSPPARGVLLHDVHDFQVESAAAHLYQELGADRLLRFAIGDESHFHFGAFRVELGGHGPDESRRSHRCQNFDGLCTHEVGCKLRVELEPVLHIHSDASEQAVAVN